MAAREFHCLLTNNLGAASASRDDVPPMVWKEDYCETGEWQDPWYPSRKAGRLFKGESGEWRAESEDGTIAQGTEGWALWAVRILDIPNFLGAADEHFDWVKVSWSVPWIEDDTIDIFCEIFPDDSRHDVPDTHKPSLSVTGRMINADGSETVLAQAAEIAPSIFGFPFVAAIPQVFIPRRKVHFTINGLGTDTNRSRLTFPSMVPGPNQMAMESFRHTIKASLRSGFAAAFPTFYEAHNGRDHTGGAILLNSAAAKWMNVPKSDLDFGSLEDFPGRMRAAHTCAQAFGYVGGFPTFYHTEGRTSGTLCGTVMLRGDCAAYEDIPVEDLGNPAPDDYAACFRAVNDYAVNRMYLGGFPTLFREETTLVTSVRPPVRRRVTRCGAVLIKPGVGERRDLLLFRDPA